MANSKKPRKKQSKGFSGKEVAAINNVKSLLKNTLIGACQIQPQASFTKHNKRILDKPTIGMSNAFQHIKFHWKFCLGVVSRNKQGIPQITYQFVYPSHHVKLYDEEFSSLVMAELKRMFLEADENHRLTTFWLGSPNEDYPDVDFLVAIYQLLDKYRVYDNMITHYDESNNIERGRSLHSTTYWYGLTEFTEIEPSE